MDHKPIDRHDVSLAKQFARLDPDAGTGFRIVGCNRMMGAQTGLPLSKAVVAV